MRVNQKNAYFIQGACKILGRTSEVSWLYQNSEEVRINTWLANSSRGTFEGVRKSMIRFFHASTDLVGDISSICLNCELINNMNSKVIKLGTCNVNVLCQL